MALFDFLEDEAQSQAQKHLASFLRYVYDNNPDFSRALTREELTTCWLNDYVHPPWIDALIAKGDIRFIAHVNEYFEAYHDGARLLSVDVEPTLRPVAPPPTAKRAKKEPITKEQLVKLLPLIRKFGLRVYAKSLTKDEAARLLQELQEKDAAERGVVCESGV